MRVGIFGSALFALLACAASASPAARAAPARAAAWGIVGNYAPQDISALASRGFRIGLVEMTWSSAEPSEGEWNDAYFASIRARVTALQHSGIGVVLNFGIQDAPAWLLAKPGARFVNQEGTTYTADSVANLVFALGLRRYAVAYTREVFRRLGRDFYVVRVGGLHWGELAYPYAGRGTNDYWAFDASAQAARSRTPFAHYVPCTGAAAQASGFVSWYLRKLVEFQNWQVRTVRRFFRGPIAVLYPSHGIAPGDAARAARANLCGTTSAEVNGELQRGIDHATQIAQLPRLRCLAAWSTWADNASAAADVFEPAERRGLLRMGENSGDDRDATSMQNAVASAVRFGLTAFLWIRLDASEPAMSTIERFTTAIDAVGGLAPPARGRVAPCTVSPAHRG